MNVTYLLILSMVIWGISWVCGKIVAGYTHSEVIVFWRNVLTVFSILPVLFFLKIPYTFNRRVLFRAFLASLTMTAYNYAFFYGLQKGMAGSAGVLVTSLNPIFNFLIVIAFDKHKLTTVEAVSLLIGCVGGLIQIRIWEESLVSLFEKGVMIFLAASLIWAVLSYQTQHSRGKAHPLYFSFLLYLFSTIFIGFLSLPHSPLVVFSFDFRFWGNLAYLSILSTSFATTVYFIATTRIGSHKASIFIFLVPTVAAVASWIFLDEKPQWYTIVGGAMTIVAVNLLNLYYYSKKTRATT
jgi:drug/metabolite transporter (DMT)-like permease